MSAISFTKTQGAGNDFLILETAPPGNPPAPEWIRRICDRHYGIGADGLLWLASPGSSGADADLRIFNCDGGEAEISGNGTRCAAAHLVDTGRACSPLAIRTVAGLKRLTLVSRDRNRYVFEMSMGKPIMEAKDIPFRPAKPVSAPITNFELPLSAGRRRATVTSMGNPHCSLAVEHFDWDWQALGAEIEKHPFFPNRTNVEFYQVLSAHEIAVRYWERGVGTTLSSGTGSCAAVLAAILTRQAETPVTVITATETLRVRWDEEVFLTGPAEIICRGDYFNQEETPAGPGALTAGT